jgi:hypothetical protein
MIRPHSFRYQRYSFDFLQPDNERAVLILGFPPRRSREPRPNRRGAGPAIAYQPFVRWMRVNQFPELSLRIASIP